MCEDAAVGILKVLSSRSPLGTRSDRLIHKLMMLYQLKVFI
jgi:hypothetical protein